MSTVAVYNGFGQYETRDKEKGITLKFASREFWLPFQKVTYFPDFFLKEIDWNKSTGNEGEETPMVYQMVRITGQRLAEELLETQVPHSNSYKGIVEVKGTKTTFMKTVHAGYDENGNEITAEVSEIVPTAKEIEMAEGLALNYKQEMIQQYFMSKRERLAGGHGQIFPTGAVKIYMNELGIKDIDDVTKQTSAQDTLVELARLLKQPAPAAAPLPQTKESLSSLI